MRAKRAKRVGGGRKATQSASSPGRALKNKDVEKSGGRRKPQQAEPLLAEGVGVPPRGRRRGARATPARRAGTPSGTEKTATRCAKAWSTGISQGGMTGARTALERTHSRGRKGRALPPD